MNAMPTFFLVCPSSLFALDSPNKEARRSMRRIESPFGRLVGMRQRVVRIRKWKYEV